MKKKLHKTLLALLIVFVPPYFLLFTEEGNRVSDNAVLWLFDREEFRLDLNQASNNFTEDEIKKVYEKIDWKCGAAQSNFGDYACNSLIGAFNELPAERAFLYFAGKQLSAIQIVYRDHYHKALISQLIETIGQPLNALEATRDSVHADPVLQWKVNHGSVILKKTIGEGDQPALLWLGSTQ